MRRAGEKEEWGLRPCQRVGVCTKEGALGPLPESPAYVEGHPQRESITLPVLKVVLMLTRAGCLGGLEKRRLSRLKRTFVRGLHTLTSAKK